MGQNWRDALEVLGPQFEALAQSDLGLHNIFVEDARREKEEPEISDFLPSWISGQTIGGTSQRDQPIDEWHISASFSMRAEGPSFRAPRQGEEFSPEDESNLIRDQSGVVRAVAERLVPRSDFLCGKSGPVVNGFRSLATSAAIALTGATDLGEHVFASELREIFRPARGGIRYVFGTVPSAPSTFISSGWNAGVLQFPDGVLIDLPLSEGEPDSGDWLLLLHRLGWKCVAGSPLRATRKAWSGNVETDVQSRASDFSRLPEDLRKQFEGISTARFYSVLGTKEVPLDVNLASALAIKLLLSELSSVSDTSGRIHGGASLTQPTTKPLPVRTVQFDELPEDQKPRIAIVVVTEVERNAVLHQLDSIDDSGELIQVHEAANSFVLGRLGLTNLVLCRSAMGSIGRDASQIVTAELIRTWKPLAVIMAGIAFGKDASKQRLGNVLISDRIVPYEPQRVGENEVRFRGDSIPAGPILLDRFRNVLGWSFPTPDGADCGHQTGPILSGEKLVDNACFKESLFLQWPKAIGGEMEGAGLAAAATRQKCEWIVVKAICDWGDGTKSSDFQGYAAAASVDLIRHVLNQPGVLDALSDN